MNQLAQLPSFTLSDAESISAQHFGISGTASPLDSERDRNFKIESDELTFVLKIANPATDPRLLELENAAIQIAAGCRHFRCPKLIKTLANSPMVLVRDSDGQDCQVRMISFLAGSTLARTSSPPGSTWFQLGQALGNWIARWKISIRIPSPGGSSNGT